MVAENEEGVNAMPETRCRCGRIENHIGGCLPEHMWLKPEAGEPRLHTLIEQAVANRGAPKGDLREWADKIAHESVKAGESEYGPASPVQAGPQSYIGSEAERVHLEKKALGDLAASPAKAAPHCEECQEFLKDEIKD